MKPTREQAKQWYDEWINRNFTTTIYIGLQEYIAQRAAEWAFEEAAKKCDNIDCVIGSKGHFENDSQEGRIIANRCADAIRK